MKRRSGMQSAACCAAVRDTGRLFTRLWEREKKLRTKYLLQRESPWARDSFGSTEPRKSQARKFSGRMKLRQESWVSMRIAVRLIGVDFNSDILFMSLTCSREFFLLSS